MSYYIRPHITLSGYDVKYVDMREPKPRSVYVETFVLDTDTIAAAGRVGLEIPELIRQRYERGGYHVLTVEKVKGKRQPTLDLQALWLYAEKEKTPCINADQSPMQEVQ